MLNPHKTLVTKSSLVVDLKKIGLCLGDTVLVHCSLSSLGWVCGGAVSVIEALSEAIGENGTLVMPTHTSNNTDPRHWENPHVPKEWWPIIRSEAPPFNSAITPSNNMGVVAELFRTWSNTLRSNHPIGSFAARGPNAEVITSNHAFDSMFGEGSPLARLYDLNGKVLFLGTGHSTNTCFHLAEGRASFSKKTQTEGCAMLVNGLRKWVEFEMPVLDTDDFEIIGTNFEKTQSFTVNQIGGAKCKLFKIHDLIDFATHWMSKNRT